MSNEDLNARLDRLEKVLGLQKLGGGSLREELEVSAARGLSTQSNHCGGSWASVHCLAREAEAFPTNEK
ncbi:hypothetical protein ACIOK4_45040 [Streptomyces bottropensis]|uniref:hypothetical protein n=1 Tax=Streptomyces bottropensis TaxID=42235 RepID=UPI0037B28FB1